MTIYDELYEQRISAGSGRPEAATYVIEAFLGGRPSRQGKRISTGSQRNEAFWSSAIWVTASAECFESDAFVLALARYFGQDAIGQPALLHRIARVAPDAIRRAVRYSGLVLRQRSPRWIEFEQLAASAPGDFGNLLELCHRFQLAHRQRFELVEALR